MGENSAPPPIRDQRALARAIPPSARIIPEGVSGGLDPDKLDLETPISELAAPDSYLDARGTLRLDCLGEPEVAWSRDLSRPNQSLECPICGDPVPNRGPCWYCEDELMRARAADEAGNEEMCPV